MVSVRECRKASYYLGGASTLGPRAASDT